MNLCLRLRIKIENLTTFTILFDAQKNLTLRISNFPARPFLVKIGRTICVHVFRTIQNYPARVFTFPEI
jgi:hypothetical protein